MQEQSPNKTINQSQGSNMHPISGNEFHRKKASVPGHSQANQQTQSTQNIAKPQSRDHQQKQQHYQHAPAKPLQPYVPNNKNNFLQIGTGSMLPNFQNSKTSNKKFGVVKSFAANTHVGLMRKANEDRIAIILNVI